MKIWSGSGDLQNAIRKIDKETRTRFKETFDKINGGLQSLFPRIFGGGHAYLDMTGEDLLDTGVAIMARPRVSETAPFISSPAVRKR